QHLEMIVALADEQLDWLAGRFHGGMEVAALTLELRRLIGAIGKDERCMELVDMALRAERLLHLVRELDVFRSLRKPHRREIVHAAAQRRTLEDVGGEILLSPIMGDHAAAEMRAGGMRGEIEPVGIAAEPTGVLVDEADRAAHLLDHGEEAAAGVVDI